MGIEPIELHPFSGCARCIKSSTVSTDESATTLVLIFRGLSDSSLKGFCVRSLQGFSKGSMTLGPEVLEPELP